MFHRAGCPTQSCRVPELTARPLSRHPRHQQAARRRSNEAPAAPAMKPRFQHVPTCWKPGFITLRRRRAGHLFRRRRRSRAVACPLDKPAWDIWRGRTEPVARLAISKGFLAEYAKLDKDVQGAVDEAIATFARHPHPGQHLEKPRHGRDDRIRIMPVDGRWRGVVLAPADTPTADTPTADTPTAGTPTADTPTGGKPTGGTPTADTPTAGTPTGGTPTGGTYCLVTVLPQGQAEAYATSHRFSVSGPEELQLVFAHPFATWRTFLHPDQRQIAYHPRYSGPAQVTGGPGTGKTVTVLHRAAFLAERAEPVLVTTFAGNLADALAAQLDLLIRDPQVRQNIEVLNVDRLAYRIVKQARGTPVIADERILRARWTEAAASNGLTFTPAFGKNEWEQVILAQDLHTEQAYLTCQRTGRGRPLSRAQRTLVWQAVAAGHRRTRRHQPDHPPAAGQRGHAPAPASGSAALPAHPRGRGPGPAPVPVAAAPRGRRARPGRPVHRGRPAPARLRQPGLPGQPADQRAGPEPAAVPELPDHPGDPGLGCAAARHGAGDRPGRRGGLPARLPVADARPAPAAKGGGHPGRGIQIFYRTDRSAGSRPGSSRTPSASRPGPLIWSARRARR